MQRSAAFGAGDVALSPAANPHLERITMSILRKIGDVIASGTGAVARALTAGFDALTGPVGRINDRVEAHLRDRTTLLRAHYGNKANREAKPLPVLEGPIDLSMRGGMRDAA